MFEEYQFLRYFIPGSLYVIYSTLLIFPLLSSAAIDYFIDKPDAILGVIGGAFGASLAFGYLIYTFYDTFDYNRIAMDENRRPLLNYVAKNVGEEWKNLSQARKKMFIEMIHTYVQKDESDNCNRFYSIGRGFWSHFSARIVCCSWVPLASIVSVVILYALTNIITSSVLIFSNDRLLFYLMFWGVSSVLIAFISFVLWYRSDRPYNEAVEYEYLFVRKLMNNKEGFDELKKLLDLPVVNKETTPLKSCMP